MSKAQTVLLSMTVVAAAALYEKRIVSRTGLHAAGKCGGVANFDAALGDAASMIIRGHAVVIAGGAITAGAMVTADSLGKAIAYVPNSNTDGETIEILGVALEAASGTGVEILVDVNPFLITGTGNEVISLTAGEAITANRIVDIDGKHTDNKGIGVSLAAANSAASVSVQISGEVTVLSGGAFAIGDYITSDADGKAVKFDPTNINMGTVVGIVGIAVQAATDTGQSKTIRLFPNVAVGTKAIG